jgi:Matrixin
MTRGSCPVGSALVAALLVFGQSNPARAFCVASTCTVEDCAGEGTGCVPTECPRADDGCSNDGAQLYYAVPCLSFAVAGGAAAVVGMSDQRFVEAVEQAFAAWAAAPCPGGGTPGFSITSAGVVDTGGSLYCSAEPEKNLSVWTFATEWTRPAGYGYTTRSFDVATGRVFDADVEINVERLREPSAVELESRLSAIAVHEAGHSLGLDHSAVPGALMGAYPAAGELVTELSADDIDAVCSLYPPAAVALECPLPKVSPVAIDVVQCARAAARQPTMEPEAACSTRVVRHSEYATLFALGVLCATWGERRRRASAKRG